MKESLSIFASKRGKDLNMYLNVRFIFLIWSDFYLLGASMKDPKVKVSLLYTKSKICYDSVIL